MNMYPIARRRRFTIGVLAGWQAYTGVLDSFLSNVIRGIQAAARQLDWNLLIGCGVLQSGVHTSVNRPAWPLNLPDVDFVPVGHWNCDGILAIPPFHNLAGLDYIRDLQARGFPVAYTGDWQAGPGAMVDNYNGVRQALFHLIEHGHRQIAFIAGRRSNLEGDSLARLRGYMQGLVDAGLPYDPELVEYGYHNEAGGREAMQRLLAKKRPFSALIASNDQSAIGAIDVLREAGLHVPHDVAVVGFDDRLEARANVPSLTTVHYPMFEMGYRTAEVLHEILTGEDRNPPVVHVPTRLVIRESCGCLPGDVEGSAAGSLGKGTGHAPGVTLKDELSELIANALFNDVGLMALHEVERLSRRLTENFFASIEAQEPVRFRESLQQVLDFLSMRGEDLHVCQKAITVLREGLGEILGSKWSGRHRLAEEMLDQARVAISDLARRESYRNLVHSSSLAQVNSLMMAQFFAAGSEAGLIDVFHRFMPLLGIRHAEVFFYEEENNDPFAWSRQAVGTEANSGQRRFVTRQFPPAGLYSTFEPFNLVLLPLQSGEKTEGFVAYEGSNLEQFGLVNGQLMAAIKSIRLYQEALASRREAEEANRLKSRFLSMVSHELRTPLNLISGLSNMLLRERETHQNGTARVNWEDLERIYISAQHLDGLIRDVIELSSLDVGTIRLSCEPLDLREVLDSVAVIGKQLARDKGLAWSAEYPRHLPWVLGDRTRLRQIILNLITNAVKFTQQGYVLLTAFVEDHQVTVAISDTGLGIPPEEQEVIFDEFRQSSRTTARGFGGFGLGLSICRRLVEMHGGKLAVCSTGKEGEGSTFYFTLPVIDRPVPVEEPGNVLEDRQRVLILVEEWEAGEVLRGHLSNAGFEVNLQMAEDEKSWRDWIYQAPPEAVILDRGLASKWGWDILKHLKEKPATADVPVFFYALEDGGEGAGALLELNYMTKPVDAALLTEALMSLDIQSGLTGQEQPQGKTVLIVDDDPGILDLHRRIVEAQSSDNRVLLASSGREALERVKQECPDLILLDLMMPEMDGFAVLDALRASEASRNIPVVVVTGQALTEEDIQRLNQGATAVLSKGIFTREEMLETLTTALLRSRKPGTESQRLVLKAMAYIHSHYKEDISRSDIAAHVGVSERHLARCFQNEIGLSPITYLNRFRVKVAKGLLDQGKLSITEVAMEAGFSSGGYFTRVFREEVGISPRAYVQSQRG
ncbi:MAG TPA: ATPase [Anaerolinea thermolimosa]|uniref:Circadian input-output histidine kinase CikA n=1 Tax=Anaerolinea thermolimosa TaxID=229919 RepID=A0A3D1JEK7_9CHLR|nr:ATPase [Anaerolinea thermolimosa]